MINGIKIINNCINLDVFKPLPNKVKGRNLLFVGRFIYQKNPIFLIEVFAEYCKLHDDARLTCVGDGVMRQECIQYAKDNGIFNKIQFIDKDSEMSTYYQTADVFLLPSFYEGLGIVLIEAQATKCPCLTSSEVPDLADCGMVHYKRLDDGAASWAKAIDELLNTEMSIDQDKLDQFSSKRTAEIVYEAYEY